jgi:PucR family transcriptional regulator, purine catabolism regulatory protein
MSLGDRFTLETCARRPNRRAFSGGKWRLPVQNYGTMRVRELLGLPIFAGTSVVAGAGGLDREVHWAHVVDMPEPAPWVGAGQVLLTTGFSWPGDAEAEGRQLEALAGRQLAAIGLAVPGFVEHFSPAARALADRFDLPLLEIPWDVPFARITEELHREILTAQQNLIARSEAIHRELTRAASDGITLHDLAARLGHLIGRSITIEDAHFQLLAAHASDPRDDGARRETPTALLEELERSGRLGDLLASSAPVRLPPLPELEFAARVGCPIRVGGAVAGFVWIIEGHEPLSELDHRAAEHAALVAALQMAHERALALVEARLGYASFLSLLEAPAATPLTLERARLLGFDPSVAYRVGVVLLDEPLPLGREGVLRRDATMEKLRRFLAASGSAPILCASLNRIPFLLEADVDVANVDRALEGSAVRLAFGRVATGTDGVRVSYREALDVLGYENAGRVARYEDALLPRVLLGDAAARAAFIAETLGGLDGHKAGAALRAAVLRYAEEGFALRRTATALGIHPNTLRYRLERATDLTGLSFDDADVRFRLQLAARLLRLSDLRDKTGVEN